MTTPLRPPSPTAKSADQRAHQEWIGFVQPVGLVVSTPALEKAQCRLSRNVLREEEVLRSLLVPHDNRGAAGPDAIVPSFAAFAREVLGWSDEDIALPPDSLAVPVPEYGEVLRPTVVAPDGKGGHALAIVELPARTPLDAPLEGAPWPASPEARFERLLRESEIATGILWNGAQLRLVHAPRGESAGHITFDLAAMRQPSGRPILGALSMLLGVDRLFTLPDSQRLRRILEDSRRFQTEVSTRLAEQVLGALYELLRGFQSADEARGGTLLAEPVRDDPDHVYGGLLATLLRLVFLLYAEDRGLLPKDDVYVRHYAVTGLFAKLREDGARHPDTMDQRFGAWSRLLSLFRLIHDGGEHGTMHLPPRYGRLFDPDAYPFLEGRAYRSARQKGERLDVPRVSDGVVLRVLSSLLLLDGDRLSYRALDVEQIGSVYEAMMGFTLERVLEPSVALRAKKKAGAPPADPVVSLAKLLAAKGKARSALLGELGIDAKGKAGKEIEEAKDQNALLAALGRRISPLSPGVLQPGALALQPTEERRRSGSHYTPRALTEPIVEKTLRPILESLGEHPTPQQIEALKVCDPAMGSGAFLVATCRALGRRLAASWQRHGMPKLPPDEDIELHARRVVAQQCLYGVDKNPFAVDLAKLSLWLTTLAQDHPFTFLDHALRQGDSLVGLSRAQIARFHWSEDSATSPLLLKRPIDEALAVAVSLRERIQDMAESDDTQEKRRLLADAEHAIARVRKIGNLVIDAFFSEEKDKARKDRLKGYAKVLEQSGLEVIPDAPEGEARTPFHWEIEFPEVFARENGGFDAFVGNPPFMGGAIVSEQFGMTYFAWIKDQHPPAGHLCDLVAYFFRRTFSLLRRGGTLGLVATNTIAQGDTRDGGLAAIVRAGGVIFNATRRLRWPGIAAVVVSVVHIRRGAPVDVVVLDATPVERITSFLFHTGGDESPVRLPGRNDAWSLGTKIYGAGFLFEDGNEGATPIAVMREILERHPSYREVVRPYIGGEELNSDPRQEHRRFVINLTDVADEESLENWPELAAIIRARVKPERDALGTNPNNTPLKRRWWAYQGHRPHFYAAARLRGRVLASSQVSAHLCFAFQPTDRIFANTLNLFLLDRWADFALLQSRAHEVWARFFGSSMKDDPRYTPSDCFETYPFPLDRATGQLEPIARTYYEFRAELMVRSGAGMTATYNRVHDPDERDRDVLRLRELHAEMDRAVLDAYGWTDLHPTCEFLLDYEAEEEDEDAAPNKRAKKKPWRYRWPDPFRDEVLARLLALNAPRATNSPSSHE